jgi:antitoxin component of MazEF toxin-antitoxin module
VIYAKLRRSGKNYTVRIPAEEIERRGLADGDLIVVEIRGVTIRPKLSPDLLTLAEKSWLRHKRAYRKLGGL